ncbi:MAG: hypothetical protein JWP83_1897 [Mycobacterium sp.]|uniref:hypothetical protein n=1 Tax=Mycobacterium sp. TaxID=1785 RepID=UPI0026326EE4|nr:hypothetical protein [Mycobacterium sp.]MCW2660745.1 hypothetical protein [Mycobacterium sp.]
MTPINWERLPGDTVEEYVEALILTTVNPRATRITPSRGDKGIDILGPVGEAFDVYQVKRYTRPFGKSSNEEKSIVGSWDRFVQEILPNYPIRRWILVTPWNPTTERYEWMLNELTAGVAIERDWLGRGSLDVWSSENPGLQDYFFGDGQRRTLELVAAALRGQRDVTELTGEPLVDAIAARELELARSLDEVDPFYRYESSIRTGRLPDSVEEHARTVDPNAALVTFRELDDNHFHQLAIYPRCAESLRLRPISTTVSFGGITDEAALKAARDMIAYGAQPDRPLPVRVIRSEGPPGVSSFDGPAMLYVMNEAPPARPDLELRLGERRTPFRNISITRGFDGIQLHGEDASGVFKVTITVSNGGELQSVEVLTLPVGGKLPHAVISGFEFLREWAHGGSAILAIPYGRIITPLGSLPEATWLRDDVEIWLATAQNLTRLQSVSDRQFLMPWALSSAEGSAMGDAVRLLNGEILKSEWSSTNFEVRNVEALGSCLTSGPLFQFLSFLPFVIEYDGSRYDLDGVVATWGVAQLADPSAVESIAPGDQVAIVPGADGTLYRQYGSPEAASTLPVV